jgi:hypothetical protein
MPVFISRLLLVVLHEYQYFQCVNTGVNVVGLNMDLVQKARRVKIFLAYSSAGVARLNLRQVNVKCY